MRRLLGCVVVGAAFLLATPAAALTCAPPDLTSDELVAADLVSPSNAYDLAVVGQVVGITTDLSEGDEHGRTYVQLSVTGVFGSTSAGQGIVVTTPDPGWNSGFPFEEGVSYFVPILVSGPQGEVNFVGACDLVEELTDPAATAQRLATVAAGNGVDYTYPIASGGGAVLATVLVLALLGGLLFWTARMRQSSRRELNGTGSDPRRPQLPRL